MAQKQLVAVSSRLPVNGRPSAAETADRRPHKTSFSCGDAMKCSIGIGVVDQGTAYIADSLQPYLEQLSSQLSKDCRGSMEHLWIAIEMCPTHADQRPPWPFRCKRLSKCALA